MVNDNKKPTVPKEPLQPVTDKRHKAKRPKPPTKPKPAKKRKCEGPSCSMFLAELSKKLSVKKKQEEERNIVQTIIDSITNALPVKFSKRTPPKKESPIQIETLQSMAPELIPNDTVEIKVIKPDVKKDAEGAESAVIDPDPGKGSNLPRMPLKGSEDLMKISIQSKNEAVVEDVSIQANTNYTLDVASEIAKHVGTLKKISLIAEEFNQKTAKNLKEIVESVQLDLLRKLEDLQAEERSGKSHKEPSRSQSPSMIPRPVSPLPLPVSPLPLPATIPAVEPMQT